GASGVLKATSTDPWSASFMVETRTACFEHSNFFKVTAPEARPSQYATHAPDQFNKHKTMLVKKLRRILGAKQSARKFAGKVTGKFIGDNPAIDLNPAIDSVGPSNPTLHTPSGRLWLSVGVRQHTQDVRGTSVGVRQHTQDVRGYLCVSISTHRTFVAVRVCPCVSVCVRQHTHDIRGCPSHTQDVRGCPCVSVCVRNTHRTSVAVPQYTYQHVGPWTQHAGPSRGLFGCFCPNWAVCSVHTGRPWVSASTHRTSGAVCGCLSAHTGHPSHTGHPWLSVCVRVCSSLSVSKHRTSVAVHQSTYQHVGRPWVSASTHRTSVAVRVCPCTSVGVRQHTQDVRVCIRQHTQDVRVCSSAHTGRPWLSISTHISTLHTQDVRVCVRQHTQDFRVCVRQHTQDVRVCSSAHTGRPWLSISTHISTLDVHSCPSVHISARWSLDSSRWPFPWTVRVILAHYIYQHADHTYQHARPSHGLFVY
ncbi:unnamed protein product, partial [Brassica rapa]